MVEPVTATAAAGAAAVAAPAAGTAAPAAAPAGAAAGAPGGAAAGPGAVSGLTPANALKSIANGLDSVAALPTARGDPGGFVSTLQCHASGRQPASQDPQAPSGMPNLDSPISRSLLELPDHTPGIANVRPPAARETPLDPSPRERARDDHGRLGVATEPTPERRADAAKPDLQERSAIGELAPTPDNRANAPTAEAAGAPDGAMLGPHPDERVAAERPGSDRGSREQPNRAEGPTSEDRTQSEQPAFERKTEAALKGFAGGVFGFAVPNLFDLSVSLLSMSEAWEPWLADMQVESASQEFREFGEAATHAAVEQDETFGTAGAVLGALGPEAVSPSSKGRAAKAVVGKVIKAKLAKTAVDTGKKKVDDLAAKKAAKEAARKAALAVESSAPYRELQRKGLVSTQPVKESGGSWFQKWVAKKDHEYVGVLKNGDTVQIDDFVVGADGKLVIVEAKFMKKATEIAESGHTKFAAEKVDHIKRLIRFANENKDTVSHIEFTVSRTSAAAIYADIIVSSIKQNVIGPLITFGKP